MIPVVVSLQVRGRGQEDSDDVPGCRGYVGRIRVSKTLLRIHGGCTRIQDMAAPLQQVLKTLKCRKRFVRAEGSPRVVKTLVSQECGNSLML